jgi:hypothetical protein
MNHEEKFAVLREGVAYCESLEGKIDGIFGNGAEREGSTWGQQERQRLCLDAVVRLRRQLAQLTAEIALGPTEGKR